VSLQDRDELGGKHGDAVLLAFTVSHEDLVALEVHVFDPKSNALDQTLARAVQERCDEPVDAV
jgi:hypothetical protein